MPSIFLVLCLGTAAMLHHAHANGNGTISDSEILKELLDKVREIHTAAKEDVVRPKVVPVDKNVHPEEERVDPDPADVAPVDLLTSVETNETDINHISQGGSDRGKLIDDTREKLLRALNANLLGKSATRDIDEIIDPNVRTIVVQQLKAKRGNRTGPSANFVQEVGDIITEMAAVDDRDDDITKLLHPDKKRISPPSGTKPQSRRVLQATEIKKKSIEALAGRTVDLSSIAKTARLTVDGKLLNFRRLKVDTKLQRQLQPYLFGEPLVKRVHVWAAIAQIEDLIDDINNFPRTKAPRNIETIGDLWEEDILLEPEDVDELIHDFTTDPSLLEIQVQRNRTTATINPQGKAVREKITKLLSPFLTAQAANRTRVKRKMTSRGSARWSIPIRYKIKSGPSSIIKEAIKLWEKNTCLRFKKISGLYIGNYLKFKSVGSSCWSKVGRKPWYIFGQTINIGSGCHHVGIVAHEIGHSIGFWHEQSRPDRDRYIKVYLQNIINGRKHNFAKRSWKEVEVHRVSYDYSSLMHYPRYGFSKNGQVTLTPKENYMERTVGQRNELSFYDLKLANYHYCQGKCSGGLSWSHCRHDGYRNPNHCSVCKCPDGWYGSKCQYAMYGSTSQCGSKYLYASNSWKTLESPGYTSTNGYPYKARCTWKIRSSSGKRVMMRFIGSFQFPCPYKRACKDFVEVRYNHMARAGPRFCCSATPSPIFRSHGRYMLINLRVYSMSRRKGFKLQYRNEGCGGCWSGAPNVDKPCIKTVVYMCPGKYYVRCGFWGLSRCAKYRANTCYKKKYYCCTSYELQGGFCKKKYGPWSSWGPYTTCSKNCGMCGRQTKQRTRICITPPCQSSKLVDKQTKACPSNACSNYIYRVHRTTTKCGFLGWRRCTKYRSVSSGSRCCPGYRQVGNQCVL